MPPRRKIEWVSLFVTAMFIVGLRDACADEFSFRNDVMAILSKSGCNQGTCHGSLNGKNGFKLSLRGEDAEFDLAALSRDTHGRRVNLLRPGDSLLLQKATAVMPHEGGRRFAVGSREYETLFQWIATGAHVDPSDTARLERIDVTPAEQILIAPASGFQLAVMAKFSDGRSADVTGLAVYELTNAAVTVSATGQVQRAPAAGVGRAQSSVLVRYLERQVSVPIAFVPAAVPFQWRNTPESNYIDQHVFQRLRQLHIHPSDLSTDAVFLRRVYLDTIGILPTMDETRSFLSDTRPDKRRRLIDDLLNRPEFADFWALKWADLLRNEEKVLDAKGVQIFHQWLRQWIADDKPLNELAREILSARGSTYDNPPANYYRALRDPYTRAEATAQVFLGVRLQCAKCHNHPFDRWTQNDYHGLAAAFARIQYQIVENNRKDRFDKHEFDGEQIVYLARDGEVRHPRTQAAMQPRMLAESQPIADLHADRLEMLADWVANVNNPFFARVQANRIWFHVMGQGIVDPIDDFRITNPPSNAPLLDAITKDFTDHGFRLRPLLRSILNSRTYQLAAIPNESNRDDEWNFSHARIRRIQAEPLLDAVVQVTGGSVKFPGYPNGLRATQIAGIQKFRDRDRRNTDADRFLKVFGKPPRLLNCECERSDESSLSQAFEMKSGPLLNDLLTQPENRLGRLLAARTSPEAIVEVFYLSALSRFPHPRERQLGIELLAKSVDRRAALEDLVWGLLNAKEFLLRQ